MPAQSTGHAPPPPPLLLTKRVTTFLTANLTSTLHTACLTTPSGNLLAHASTVAPARTLRRQAAVAASLWAIHSAKSTPYSKDVQDALPNTTKSSSSSTVSDQNSSSTTPDQNNQNYSTKAITVQLEGEETGSVVVIRGLKCGVLFMAIAGEGHRDGHADGLKNEPLASPGETDSVLSHAASHTTTGSTVGGMSTAAVLAVRRQTEELAKWMDERFGALAIPEDCVGSGWETR